MGRKRAAHKRTSYTYDEYKRLLTVTNPLNQTTRYINATNGGSSFLHHQ